MPQLYEYRLHRRRISTSKAQEDRLCLRIENDEDLAQFFRSRLVHQDREQFFVGHIDAQNRLTGYELTAIGSLTGVDVHPREVFRGAIIASAAAIVMAHNHPSGSTLPSDADDELTQRLVDGGHLIGIPVLDHLIVAEHGHYSYGQANRYIRAGK